MSTSATADELVSHHLDYIRLTMGVYNELRSHHAHMHAQLERSLSPRRYLLEIEELESMMEAALTEARDADRAMKDVLLAELERRETEA